MSARTLSFAATVLRLSQLSPKQSIPQNTWNLSPAQTRQGSEQGSEYVVSNEESGSSTGQRMASQNPRSPMIARNRVRNR
jgi:hypothetical protein